MKARRKDLYRAQLIKRGKIFSITAIHRLYWHKEKRSLDGSASLYAASKAEK